MDDVLLGQAVQHRRHFFQQLLSGRFIGCRTQLLDGRAGGFVLVAVQHALGFVAADAFEGRLMVCHEQEYMRALAIVLSLGGQRYEAGLNFQTLLIKLLLSYFV